MKTFSKIVLILIMLFSTTNLTFLAPIVEATNNTSRMIGELSTFGGRNDDYFNSVTATSDGYVAVGYSDSAEGDIIGLNKGFQDAIIVKYDKSGNVKWKKTFGGSSGDIFNSVTASGNGYVAVGFSSSTDNDLTDLNKGFRNAIIVKYDNSGNVEWKNTLGGNSLYSFNSVTATSDGYIAVGFSNNDAVIVKYDTSGNEIWTKTFGGSESDIYKSVIATSDSYVVVGETDSTDGDVTDLNKGHKNAIIVKYDKSGNVKWKKTFGGSFMDAFNSIISTDDGYIAAGYAYSTNGDLKDINLGSSDNAIIVKYDSDGNVKWKKAFGGSGADLFNSVSTTDDGYVAVGYSTSTDQDLVNLNKGAQDALMVKYDLDGNVVWKKTVGGNRYDVFNSVTENEHGFVAVGYSSSYDGDFRALVRGGNEAFILNLSASNQIEQLTMDYSTSFRLITINPEHLDETFEWTSSNDSVIPLTYGVVSVAGYGTLFLEGISSKIIGDKIMIPIKVNEYVTVAVSPEILFLTTGSTSKLTAQVTPVDAINQNISWTSSNPSIATVDQMGNVTAINKGKVVITATSEVGNFTAISKIEVALPYYTVTFDSQGGTTVSKEVLEAENFIKRPNRPTKVGYTFGGWYKDESLTNMWNFAIDKVESETTLYAKWIINPYTVNFNSNGGSIVNSKTANYNTIITAPTAPKRTGYTFGGWYKDESLTNVWNFAIDKVESETTLYAKWIINPYTVNFNSNGGSTVKAKTTNHNTIITAPTAPKRTGYTFVGWYKDSRGKTPWNFSKDKVTANTTLYAKWTVSSPAAPKRISVNKLSSKSIKISWSRVSGVSGYKVYRATKSNGKYSLIKSTTALYFTNTSLKKGTTYYYKVRTYRLVGAKKVYSGWTVIKSAKP